MERKKYKVFQITYVWAESPKDAIKSVQEDFRGRKDHEFAIDVTPKNLLHEIWQQLTG
jgi:hypothetical protein